MVHIGVISSGGVCQVIQQALQDLEVPKRAGTTQADDDWGTAVHRLCDMEGRMPAAAGQCTPLSQSVKRKQQQEGFGQSVLQYLTCTYSTA